ncbi:hypothetical protein ACH4GK_19335 [Streptomyces rimosus]|uniref:hypothetical protein n=1 Tax=Streptomyces rimosus TaxID=1927 RepID=UPI0006919143|nr:hypothetical protein [Streptomyces rimosus]
MKRQRLVLPVAVAVGAVYAVAIGWRLASFHVPWMLLVACASALFVTAFTLVLRIAEARSTVVHRCRMEGCTFMVQVRHVDAVENRRWQEIAAAHPHRF